MTQRVINGTLLLIAVVGIVDLLRARSELRGIRAEHDRLADRFGAVDVEDPEKFYIRRINTGEPFHFAWRFYQPDELEIETRRRGLHGNTGWSRSSGRHGEGIMRLRFRFEETGLRVFNKTTSGSSTSGFGNPALAEFLKTHWDALQVDVIADEGTVEADPEQILKFLSIRIPESLLAEAQEAIGRAASDPKNNTLFDLRVGTVDAWQNAEQSDEP